MIQLWLTKISVWCYNSLHSYDVTFKD